MRQRTDAFQQPLRKCGGGAEAQAQRREEAPGRRVVALEDRHQYAVACRDVEVHGGRDVLQVADSALDHPGRGAAVVDPQRATVDQHHVQVVVAAEGVAPRQPVQQHRRLVGEERPHLAHLLLIGGEHALGVDDALGRAGGAGGEHDLRDGVRPHAGEQLLGARTGAGVGVRGEGGERDRGVRRVRRIARTCGVAGACCARCIACVAQDDETFRCDGLQGAGVAGVLGEDRARAGGADQRAELGVVVGLQRVGDARRHHRGADGHRGEHDGDVRGAGLREDHHRSVGDAACDQTGGQRIGLFRHLAPRGGTPSGAVGGAFGDQGAVRVHAGAGAERAHDARLVRGQGDRRPHKSRPVGALHGLDRHRCEVPTCRGAVPAGRCLGVTGRRCGLAGHGGCSPDCGSRHSTYVLH